MAENNGSSLNVAIARDMLAHLNSWPDKPVRFTIEELPNKVPAIMLQPLPNSGVVRKYIDGSFIGQFTFAVYYRVDQTDTKKKLSAYETLEALARWLETSELPVLNGNRKATKLEQTTTTSLAMMDEGIEDYQTIFALEYKQSV